LQQPLSRKFKKHGSNPVKYLRFAFSHEKMFSMLILQRKKKTKNNNDNPLMAAYFTQ